MTKKVKASICILVVVIMTFGMCLTGCEQKPQTAAAPAVPTSPSAPAASSAPAAPATPAFKEVKADLATAFAKDIPVAVCSVEFADKMKKDTNGKFQIQVFTDGVLGNARDQFAGMASGDIPLVMGGVDIFGYYATEYNAVFGSVAYLFDSNEQYEAMYNGKTGDNMKASLIKSNIRPLAIARRGVRNMTANKPIKVPADVKGLKLRLPDNPTNMQIWSQVGASATPIAMTELYGALQTGVVEAADGPYDQIASLKLNEVQKYLIQTNHSFDFGILYAGEKFYQSLDANVQKLLTDNAKSAMDHAGQLLQAAQEKALKTLTDGGMTVIKPDMEAFMAAAKPALINLLSKSIVSYDEVQSYKKK